MNGFASFFMFGTSIRVKLCVCALRACWCDAYLCLSEINARSRSELTDVK